MLAQVRAHVCSVFNCCRPLPPDTTHLCPQHCLTAFGAIISVPLLLQDPLCMRGDPVAVSYIEGTIFVVSGIATLLQTTFGIRSVGNNP